MCFGIRIKSDGSVVYLYRIVNYVSKKRIESVHIVRLSSKVEGAFDFLHMDYENYKKQQFETIFEFVDYMLANCRYLTLHIVKGLENEVKLTPPELKTETIGMLDRFVRTLKLSHVTLQDFNFLPVMMYLNLRESLVRNYFNSPEVENQFITFKLENLKETELIGKFSGKKLVGWIPTLNKKPELTGLLSQSFVNYVTKSEPQKFPRFLIDHDASVVKKEVLNYYYNLFPHTEAYRIYILESKEHEEVVE